MNRKYFARVDIRIWIRKKYQQNLKNDDVIKWKRFPRYWPFVRGIHRSPVNSLQKRPVTRSFDVFFDLRLKKRLSKQCEAGDLRRQRAHYDVIVIVT